MRFSIAHGSIEAILSFGSGNLQREIAAGELISIGNQIHRVYRPADFSSNPVALNTSRFVLASAADASQPVAWSGVDLVD